MTAAIVGFAGGALAYILQNSFGITFWWPFFLLGAVSMSAVEIIEKVRAIRRMRK